MPRKHPRPPPPPPFVPQKTAFAPSHVCWDVIRSNQHAAAALGSWKWLSTLAQVFGRLPDADQMAKWMCVGDRRPVIWKKKANELFALTAKDLFNVRFETVYGSRSSYEVHLMYRSDVLKLALEKHGGSLAGVNHAFAERRKRNAKRKTPDHRYYCDND